MENTERKSEERILKEGALELCIDREHITISVERFAELITKEVQLNIVRNVYFTSETYNTHDRLSFLFEPIPKKDDDNA